MDSMLLASDLMIYKIDAASCILREGERISPGVTIGESYDTEELLVADGYGHIESMHLSSYERSMIIMVRLDNSTCGVEEGTRKTTFITQFSTEN